MTGFFCCCFRYMQKEFSYILLPPTLFTNTDHSSVNTFYNLIKPAKQLSSGLERFATRLQIV